MTLTQVDVTKIEHWLQELWDRSASDLLVSEGSPPMLRVDGQLTPILKSENLSSTETEELILAILSDEKKAELARHKEVDFSFGWHDVTRFRGNAFYQRGSLSLALRVIPFYIPTFDQLGLPPIIDHFCELKQGLVLMTGPTGSGKSTSLASMVDRINAQKALHILTLEDPIEYVHRNKRSVISQREIGFDTASFPRGLRSALREDPDVVLVGEMRDPESIQTTLTIAETGHLVFATLHTNDTSTALDRIVDVFPTDRQQQIRVQLAGSLAGVVAQRLVPRLDGGLAAAFELLVATNPIRSLIREGKTHQIRNVLAGASREGMQTLEASLSALVQNGLISLDDALRHALVPSDVRIPGGMRPPAAPHPQQSHHMVDMPPPGAMPHPG
jgi:twitching motility protein PilT